MCVCVYINRNDLVRERERETEKKKFQLLDFI